MLVFTILYLSFFFALTQAVPLVARDVFNPTITSPNASTIWPIGTKQVVSWKTDNIPPDSQITNPQGKVVLGHLGPTGGLNLDLDHPLAQNFSYHVGSVSITVPNVPPRSDYIVVLFGDSGNASPAFAITQITDGGSTPVAPTPVTSSTDTSTSGTPTTPSTPTTTSPPDTPPTPSPAPYTNTAPTPDVLTSSSSSAPSALAASASTSATPSAPNASSSATSSAWARYSSSWSMILSSLCTTALAVAFLV